MGNTLKLSPPWYTYQRELAALFEGDTDIEIGQIYELEDHIELWIIVHNEKKYRALLNLLPTYPDFGNVKVKNVIKFKDEKAQDVYADVKDLFEGNPNVSEIKEITDFAAAKHLFVEFKPEVIQFYNDDTSSPYGFWNGLAQDIALDVFDDISGGVHFTTAAKDLGPAEALGKPLGEWP